MPEPITAGRALYLELTNELDRLLEITKSSLSYTAFNVAEDPDNVDKRASYQLAKARQLAFEEAMSVVTRRAGKFTHLDNPNRSE